jgi:outer membrane scaffolding protein for murein synthesis (MipA/OmpV family)
MLCRLPALSVLLLSLASISAFAADGAPLGSPMASRRSPDAPEQEVGLGIGVGHAYLGGKNTIFRAGIFGEANFANGVFLSTTDGVGYRLIDNASGFSVSASLGPGRSRRESDGEDDGHNRLQGMGNVNTAAQANVFVNYDSGPFHASTVLRQTLSARRGTELGVEASYDVVVTRDDLVQLSGGFAYANRSLMQTFFGVDATQSAASGNSVFMPKAGVAGTGVGALWRHAFNKEWVSTVGAGLTSLRADAAASPLTERRTNAGLGLSVGYRF